MRQWLKWFCAAWLAIALAGCAVESEVFSLSNKVDESSGIVASRTYPGIFWTHEDNGYSNNIYAVDATGDFVFKTDVSGSKNVDWEDIAIDDEGFLYIADTGNNTNDRKDLLVYKVKEPNPYDEAATASVESRIRFRYPGQQAFPDPLDLNYDSEALFYADETLYLLTKNRSDTTTDLYRFPSLSSTVEVELEFVSSFELTYDLQSEGSKVTAADVHPDENCLAVLAYHAIILFERPAQGDDWLSVHRKTIGLDQSISLQAEGITFFEDHLVFTNEEGQLHHFYSVFSDDVTQYP
jgi:hypothetical protein